jgi:hypothetical protein
MMGLLKLFNDGGAVETSAPPPADPYSQFDSLFDQASKETGIPVAILKAQTMQESSFDPSVVSKTGGVGLMQIQPSTAQQPGFGIDPLDPSKLTDPAENIRFGARYLAARAKAEGVQNWNDPTQAAKGLTAYNGGGDPNYAQNVFRYLKAPGGADAQPPAGPVDMYGNPVAQRASAPQEPSQQAAPKPTPFWQPKVEPANEWATNLQRVAAGGAAARPDSFTGMDGKFGQSLAGMVQSAPPEIQKQLQIISGFRSPETQQRLWDQALAKYGSAEAARKWVAPPGNSKHGDGVAVDFRFLSPEAKTWVHQNATQFGIHFPLAHEPWHAEPIGSRDGTYQIAQRQQPAGHPAGQRNPQIAHAAERGRGSLADSFTRGGTPSEGPRPMPQMMPPDLSNANDAGVRDFILRQANMAPDQTGGAGGGFTIPGGETQTVGGLGGLGGMPTAPAARASAAPAAAVAGGGGFDPGDLLQAFGMSLMSSGRKNPLENFPKIFTALSAASQERNKTAQEHMALATALVSSGMPPEQAKLFAVNPTAAQIALKQVTDAKTKQQEAVFAAGLDRQPQASGGRPEPVIGMSGKSPPPIDRTAEQPQPSFPSVVPSQAGPGSSWSRPAGQSQPQPQAQPQTAQATQPSQQGSPSPAAPNPLGAIDTGNKTVDTFFARGAGKVAEYTEMARNLAAAPTDRAKSAVEGRLKAIEKDIGQIDKQIETYSPTGSMKEYTYAMTQRQNRGVAPVPFEQWNPEQDKKDALTARGAQPEEVTGLRKEIQGLPSYKNVSQAAPVYKSMLDAVSRDDRASDLNLIYGLAKVMDPASVVRESEMTMAQAIATLPQQIQQNIKSQFVGPAGRLSKEVREGMMREAYSRINSYSQLFGQDAEQYRGIAQRRKMDLADVIPNFGEFKPYEPAEAKPKAGVSGSTGAAPALREVPSQYVRPDGSSPPMPSAPPPAKAFTKSDWDKLAPGELYIDAKGDTRRKGGN